MRIGLLQTQVPFVQGGAERHSASLRDALQRFGHEVSEISIPFKWYPSSALVDHTLAARMIDASEASGVPIDLAIGLRFPAYLAHHPNKVFWIIHQYRQAYDMWDAGTSDLLDAADGLAVRHMIMAEDRAAFDASPHPIYANSQNVADRVERYLGRKARPLYHPPAGAEEFYTDRFDDFLFAPGRINPSKRIDLMLAALAKTTSPVHLVVAGRPEDPAYLQTLKDRATKLGVADRVAWRIGPDDIEMRDLYARARGVVFVPQDEDYGYITLEAMLSGKPVITCLDSGGPLEFITHAKEGLVCQPKASILCEAFDTLYEDRSLAEKLGAAGRVQIDRKRISWNHVVETLTGESLPKDALRPAQAMAPDDLNPQANGTADDTAQPPSAIDLLADAIAPQEPRTTLPFASAQNVLEAYHFDTQGLEAAAPDPGLVSYLETHWVRYRATLDLVVERQPHDILDLGVFPPLVFEALLVNALPKARLNGVWEGPHPFEQRIASRHDDLPGFEIRLEAANIERDALPFATESMDMVLAMEIFEHLALDPYYVLCEAARVLRPGGHLVLTTPNVCSHRGVWKVLNQHAPYSFGLFVPSGGVYGRHNREYAPAEIQKIAASAGFETELLETRDVYDRHIDPATAALLLERRDALHLRGENILFVGRKAGQPKIPPAGLYHGDPTQMFGRLAVAHQDTQTGLVQVRIHNTSPRWWTGQNDRATSLLAQWRDQKGVLRNINVFLPLSEALGPGQSGTLSLRLDAETDAELGTLTLDLFQSGVGPLTGTGRANQLALPCSRDAFLRLADMQLDRSR